MLNSSPEMVLLYSKIGSKVVTVLCPECGRISRQILRDNYNLQSSLVLSSTHICPICKAKYSLLSGTDQGAWSAAYGHYKTYGEQSYNNDVRNIYQPISKNIEKAVEISYPNNIGDFTEQKIFAANILPEYAVESQVQVTNKLQSTNDATHICVDKLVAEPIVEQTSPKTIILNRKIEHWKNQLLDLSKRNRMINYRETKKGTLKILEPGFTELFNRLAIDEEELTFQRPIDKDSDIRTFSVLTLLEALAYPIPVHVGDIKAEGTLLERRNALNNLRSKSKLARDEQGANILYLSFGFIKWKESNSLNTTWLKSPVLMMPVSLKLESIKAPFILTRYDDDIEVNPTLDYLFNQRYGIDLPVFELNNSKESIEQYMQTIEEIADKNGWELIREVSLGLLSFLKISMYHDLNNSYDRMLKNPVIRAIAGDVDASNNIPNELANFNYDSMSPDDCYQVVNADSSQQEAIMLSKTGVSFVMQGPPGTGKSQTITNIIAEALAEGKKVLFVSEKAAALQVVYKRLSEVGLDDFCLALHSQKANKKEILDNIAINLNLEYKRIKESVMSELSELFHDRQYLNQYAHELHEEILPLEKSLYEAFGELVSLSNVPTVPFELESPSFITASQYHKILYHVSSYAKALVSLGVRFSENPWRGTTIISFDEKLRDTLLENIAGIEPKLNSLRDTLIDFQNKFYLAAEPSWFYAKQLLSLLNLFEALPMFPKEWTCANARKRLLSTAKERHNLLSSYRNGRSVVCETFREAVFQIDMDEWIASMRDALNLINGVDNYANLCDAQILNSVPATSEKLESTINELKALILAYEKLEKKTGVYEPCTQKNMQVLSVIGNMLVLSPIVRKEWCVKESLRIAKNLLNDAKFRSARLINARSMVLDYYYSDNILSFDPSVYLERFSMLYDSNMKSLLSQYENDLGGLGELYKGNAALESDVIIKLLENLTKINNLNDQLTKNDAELCSRFMNEYQGIETQWEIINRLCKQINEHIETARFASNELLANREAILAKWDRGVFDIDADAILLRFRTNYTNFLKIFKSSYRQDMRLLKGYYKVIGNKLTDSDVVALLQDIKALAEREEIFSQFAPLLAKHFSQEYKSYHTNWNLFKAAYEQMEGVKEKVASITNEIISMRKIIAQTWSADVFSLNQADIEKMWRHFTHEYTPSFYEVRRQYKEDVELFAGMRIKDRESIDDDDIIRSLHNINTINEESHWFSNDAHRVLTNTFGNDYLGYNTEWELISDKLDFIVLLYNALNCDVLPAEIVEIISDKAIHEREGAVIAEILEIISAENVEKTMMTSLSLVSATNDSSIKDVLLPNLYSLHCAFSILNAVIKRLSDYALSGFELSYDSILNYAYQIQSNNNLQRQILSFGAVDAALFGNRYTGIETDWEDLISDIDKISGFFKSPEIELFTDDFIQCSCNDVDKRGEISKFKLTLTDYINNLEGGFSIFSDLFEQEANLQFLPLTMLSTKITACLNNFLTLENWLVYKETKAECDRFGLADFTAKIEQSDNTLENVVAIFKRGFYTAWVQSVIGNKKSVEQFRRHIYDEKIARFISLDKRQLLIARERIRQNVINSIPDANRIMTANDELSILLREIGKKKRIMALRKLFKAIPNLLLKLKPCMMMSPLSVAYFLEAESYEFDMVIFDEASQIFPQDAVGAIFRGKQVVIGGDSKQLPPTNFFAASTSNNDNDYDSESEDEYENENYDSILEETAGVLPNRMLSWHYRSKHENLIAFSNQNIYENELITFPSSIEHAPDTGVEFVFVENGIYEGKGRNTGEARRCVELVKEHITRYPARSLGVIAFSESQQKTILHEIQKFREQNPQYEDFFIEDKEDEFFVKNLENVQGDERDTIIFSISYAKTKEQRNNNRPMALRFGPLGQKGGEKRLNVAITRAKRNVKLVSSILPSDIDLSRTESEGIKMLRSYLEFALNGSATMQKINNISENDVFMDTVAEFIVSYGYKIKKYVGCSGYKIDIAVIHPERENCYVAAVECDGFSYAAAKTARDRNHLRKSVLEVIGWKVYRVWSPEWRTRPEIERQKLLDFIKNAISNYTVEIRPECTDFSNKVANSEEFTESIEEELPLASPNNMPTSDSDNPYGFEYYAEATWYDAPDVEKYFNPNDKLTAIIKHIVSIEQPIIADLLYQRMAGAFGNQKATSPVRKAVEQVMNSKLSGLVNKDKNGFVTMLGFNNLKVRIPAPGSQARPINYISSDEIGLALLTIASQAIGISAKDLIDATIKALGYARKGERVVRCMNNAWEKLIKEGHVKLIDGKVNIVGDENRA